MTEQSDVQVGFESFAIDATSQVAPFRQVHDAIVTALADGRLVPGQRLPTVRALATSLGLATNTVAGAYKSLEAAGVAQGRGRAGTFLAEGDDPLEAEARRAAAEAAERLVALGVSSARAEELLVQAVRALG